MKLLVVCVCNVTCYTVLQDVFDVVKGKINPVLKRKNEVKAKCIKQKMKYDEDTMEVEGTLEQLTSLNQYLSTRFEVERGLSIEQKQEPLLRKTHQAPHHPNQQADNVERKREINLTDMEYKMLKFYCPENQVFKQEYKYENDMLIIYQGTNETEQEFKLTIQSKLIHFNSMTSFDIVPKDTTIDDDQLRKIKQEIPPDIFYYLSKDRRTLTLKGSNYEKLSVAKNKSELTLGLQKKTNNARRNRVINTDPNYENRKDKTPENRSFHQSINYSRSSSENSDSSRTFNSLAVKDLSYLTPEGLVVKVYVGSILHLTVDCIVNAANKNLMHGGGVAEVISRAAGYDFQKECDDYIQKNGPLSVTECCTTSAGNLQQYQCVIHSVGPKWYDYPYDKKRACADDLQKTIVNCFKEAEIQNVSSVALPAISSGKIL
jgi:O-acetyl-ADP-ribose deacetylase (regulator of RNase III)